MGTKNYPTARRQGVPWKNTSRLGDGERKTNGGGVWKSRHMVERRTGTNLSIYWNTPSGGDGDVRTEQSRTKMETKTMKEDASWVLLGSKWIPYRLQNPVMTPKTRQSATAKPPPRHHSEQNDLGLLEGGWGRLLGRPLPTLMGWEAPESSIHNKSCIVTSNV